MIKLTLLLPSYNYPKGVRRILDNVLPLPDSVELIIGDDSSTPAVSEVVAAYNDPRMTYIRNAPSLGAGANWNDLLDRASGQYVLLIHHDETPMVPNFVTRCLELVDKYTSDVLMLDVALVNANNSFIRRHMSMRLRRLVVQHFPAYLFRRNVIGPTGCLIVRRSIYPRFNLRLKWLIDVDLYYRLRKKTVNWVFVSSPCIGSVQGDHQTITKGIEKDINSIRAAELAILNREYEGASVWLKPTTNRFLHSVEGVAWIIFRLFERGVANFLNVFGRRP